MDSLTLQPFTRPFDATLSPPGSKSLTNRALVLAALSTGRCELTNVLFADDSRVMLDGLQQLGFRLEIDEAARRVVVEGCGGAIPRPSTELFCGNSGTTIRFLTALCSLGRGTYTLDGIPRMRQRPIRLLVDLLKNLGVRIEYLGEAGYPPVRILADGLPGGLIRFGATQSSQYLSAVLQAAPYARHEMTVELEPRQTSWPYVAMTMHLMTEFGNFIELHRDPDTAEPKSIHIPQDPYEATDYAIEPDASNASYFLATAAIHPGARVRIQGLGKRSLQGDVGFANLLKRMGAAVAIDSDVITVEGTDELQGIDANLLDMPDMAQTLAVVALFAQDESILRGLHTLRVKETDRLAALETELTKLGATVTIEDDVLTIRPPTPPRPATGVTIATYDDHRMAMSFAVAATRWGGITIADPACVNKTYPEFFTDLEKLRV